MEALAGRFCFSEKRMVALSLLSDGTLYRRAWITCVDHTVFGWWGGGLMPCCSLLLAPCCSLLLAAAAAAKSSPHPTSRTEALLVGLVRYCLDAESL